MPATCGDAIEVPDSDACRLPLPMSVEMIGLPGAAISGFRALSPLRGPPELNEARPESCGGPAVIEIDTPSRSASREPSDVDDVVGPTTPKNGMVTSK